MGFWSLSGAFWQKLYKTKVAGHPQYSGSRSLLWTPNPYLEAPGLSVLLELHYYRDRALAISTYFSHLTEPYFSILFKTSFESSWEMLGHQGENLYKIGPNKFMGGGRVCGRGEGGGVFCSVCIFHNQKMHVYLIVIRNMLTLNRYRCKVATRHESRPSISAIRCWIKK